VIESLAIVDFDLCDFSFYTILDGHAGTECADFVYERLYQHIAGNPRLKQGNFVQVMIEGYLNMDREFLTWSATHNNSSGCCTLSLIWHRSSNRLIVANVGDCRAILCRNGTPVVLSQDHRPTTPSEVERLKKRGVGFQDGRLFGTLSVTRAHGDREFKSKTLEGILIAEPEVTIIDLTPQDEFVVMASDGFWDVITTEEIIPLTNRLFQTFNRTSLGKVVQGLVDEAVRRGSTDDVTVLLLILKSS